MIWELFLAGISFGGIVIFLFLGAHFGTLLLALLWERRATTLERAIVEQLRDQPR